MKIACVQDELVVASANDPLHPLGKPQFDSKVQIALCDTNGRSFQQCEIVPFPCSLKVSILIGSRLDPSWNNTIILKTKQRKEWERKLEEQIEAEMN